MGIPRLSQDLLPYAESVVLGESTGTIDSLVIDGPSLVYFVYNKLLLYQSLSSVSTSPFVPSYAEINACILHLLNDFQSRGIAIQHIFFDGALPRSKRHIRLDRMEKLRQQLETYRKLYPDFPVVSERPQNLDFEQVLWNIPPLSTRKATPLAPPFMVASVIESLRRSEWEDQVHVVPGEADTFCACAARARESGVAILTNDSDLPVHDIGTDNSVILLHSIEKKRTALQRDPDITALSLHPQHIASRLKVPSLLRFGFERSLDSSASTGTIQERAKDALRLNNFHAEYTAFTEEYLASPKLDSHRPLNGTDPRNAELVVNISHSSTIHLTPIMEDPSRDSSWAYGADIRRLAYSFLISNISPSAVQSPTVTEHARKGQRIASAVISPSSRHDIVDKSAELLESIEAYFTSSSPGFDAVMNWYILAAHVVRQTKLKLDKPSPTWLQMSHLFGLASQSALKSKSTAVTRMTWEDTHLLANLHAVLYSLRMLSQFTGNVLESLSCAGSNLDSELLKALRDLHTVLQTMPEIAGIFLDIPALRRHVSGLDLSVRNSVIVQFRKMLEGEQPAGEKDAIGVIPTDLGEKSTEGIETHDQGNEENGTLAYENPRKKRKRERQRTKTGTTPTARSTNSFSLLMDETE